MNSEHKLSYTGGARIGIANATWPFATLRVTKNSIELNASILGRFTFMRTDIVSIVPYSGGMTGGVKINHKVDKYKKDIVFWTFQKPQDIIDSIHQIGFFDSRNDISGSVRSDEIRQSQRQKGFPFKIPFAVAVVVIWNAFFLSDTLTKKPEDPVLGTGAALAVGFVLLTSVLLLVSPAFRTFTMKEGRTLDDIRRMLYLFIIITVLLLINIVVFPIG